MRYVVGTVPTTRGYGRIETRAQELTGATFFGTGATLQKTHHRNVSDEPPSLDTCSTTNRKTLNRRVAPNRRPKSERVAGNWKRYDRRHSFPCLLLRATQSKQDVHVPYQSEKYTTLSNRTVMWRTSTRTTQRHQNSRSYKRAPASFTTPDHVHAPRLQRVQQAFRLIVIVAPPTRLPFSPLLKFHRGSYRL